MAVDWRADPKAPEQTPLPSCYTTFGLAKVTPVIETYANNPDIVLWGIRLLRNLATRDAVARDQVNRSGIEHILSSLAKHRGAPALRVSILELIYVAFTTNYTRLNQVDELSTMVLNCVTLLLLDHEDHHAVQVLALQNLVTASQHASNLEHLMVSKQVIGPCVLSLLQLAAAHAFPATADRDTIFVWGLRFMVVMGQYDRVRNPVEFVDSATSSGLVAYLLASIQSVDDRIQNLVNVLRRMLQDAAVVTQVAATTSGR
ncbi:hypothetical protein H257_15821 [Aphanomyces astaci]|uniref:Armadillo repeat-containing domain-containing protein n=1 Tax=Aphanomyces astaci TaxID=112090 RepID=W4FN29_APHAT|nr:hypothetical protein H257_15821 [Aphanomyces astaci]ETV68058.1 hypothetical protein H257_15821 [Aphanomyces astaci]|eukprot:XP_009842357.1 hypothetical protein H257_15821 [Aphanomyces astaci]